MEGFLGAAYPWIKAGHIIFVIFWMAGLFLLPRYLAHHMEYPAGGSEDGRWIERERRLMRIILNPSMHAAWTFGLLLVAHIGLDAGGWLIAKLVIVTALTIFHALVGHWRRQVEKGMRLHSSRFYRMVNEIPAIAIILVVILVIVRPF